MLQAADEKKESINSVCAGRQHLRPQCEKCFGLCCAALYFSAQDGFPAEKKAGSPCPHLAENFRCAIHGRLRESGFKGCVAYECFGAGQQVSQVTFAGRDWLTEPSSAGQMFEAFLIMCRLHEMCWYLYEALSFDLKPPLPEQIGQALRLTESVTRSDPQALPGFDLSAHQEKIHALLGRASELARSETARANKIPFDVAGESKKRADFFGRDLRKKDLRCRNLHGACLIAADMRGADLTGTDMIGADFRDADIRGADLSKSIFLTQSQVNAAKGDSDTRLPAPLCRPAHWGAGVGAHKA